MESSAALLPPETQVFDVPDGNWDGVTPVSCRDVLVRDATTQRALPRNIDNPQIDMLIGHNLVSVQLVWQGSLFRWGCPAAE